ncbi:MAG TPA: site-specific integrase [Acidimicrobiales bacterium]
MKGSIIKRGETYTAYWFTNDPATGKRKQHSKGGFRIQGDAQTYLNRILSGVEDGSWRPDTSMTVKQLLEEHWLPSQASKELRGASMAQYRLAVRAWLVPYIGAVVVSELTPIIVNKLITTLKTNRTSAGRDGLSPRTIQLAIGVLKSACKWAVQNELIPRNPIAAIAQPRADRPEMKAWNIDEAREFIDSVKDDRLAWAWTLALTRGLRRGELCGLKWDDFDFERGTLRINRARVTVEGRPIDSLPKTAAGRRSVPIDASLLPILRAHRTAQGRERLQSGGAYENSGYLCADELGRPYHPDSVSGWFESAVKKSGLRRIRFHDTRHTAASIMLASGAPVKVVSEMLGHASPIITLSIYAHVLPGMAEEAGAALSKSLLA